MKTARNKIIRGGACLVGGLLPFVGAVLIAAGLDGTPIEIQSMESKTKEGAPVFNRIRWIRDGSREIWMMQQSHDGPHAGEAVRDRLAIIVDRSSPVTTAEYVQLEPGPLEWDVNAKKVPYRVSCFLCHSNGPRAIRPAMDSAAAPLKLWDQVRIVAWNTRIKLYGRIEESGDLFGRTSRMKEPYLNEKLEVKSCTTCHNGSSWGRNHLTRQNFLTIDFMLRSGQMPPPGFPVAEGERRIIQRFVRGL